MSAVPWEQRPEVRKGNIGENIVDEFLKAKRVIPYRPVYDGAHPFDRLCATADKKTIFIADIKTKPARTYFPDSGFNLSNYGDYTYITKKYGLRIFIFFVDEDAREVYGNWLEELEQPIQIEHKGRVLSYPIRERGIIFFPKANMRHIAQVDYTRAKELMDLSTRNYEYSNNPNQMDLYKKPA